MDYMIVSLAMCGVLHLALNLIEKCEGAKRERTDGRKELK